MDVLSLIGVILAFVAILGGNYLEGGKWRLAQWPGGVDRDWRHPGGSVLQAPLNVLKRSGVVIRWIIIPPAIDLAGGIARVVGWSMTARKEGLLGSRSRVDIEPDNYARKGLQLLVDGAEPEAIRSILEVDLYTQEGRDIQAAKVFESMVVMPPPSALSVP